MKITTNGKVKLIEGLNPSDQCMVSALYSRSIKGVEEDVSQLDREGGSESFMKQHLIGFGDKSVGDNGYIMLCFENVSMYAAKVIQDNPLYSGTEVSSRYIDIGNRALHHTNENENEVQQKWMGIYRNVLKELTEEFLTIFPMGDDPKIYKRAINAKAFDIARGFIPIGMTTNLSWVTNIRQARDHLLRMSLHPEQEIRNLAKDTSEMLCNKYPDVFTPIELNQEQKDYMMNVNTMFPEPNFKQKVQLMQYTPNMFLPGKNRPRGIELNRHHGNNPALFGVKMDFGGWRDLQRHRALDISFPNINNKGEFHEWYMNELVTYIKSNSIFNQIDEAMLMTSNSTSKYVVPLGYNVDSFFSGTLSGFTYMIELRSGFGVHPTVREVVYKMADEIKANDKNVMFHQPERAAPIFNYKRGKDTITKKGK